VDAAKSQRLHLLWISSEFSFLITPGSAAAKLKLLVEEQISRGLAVLHRQRGESAVFSMNLRHAPEVNRADDIDIVQNKRFVKTLGVLKKKVGGLFKATARVEQDLLARDFNTQAEIVVRFEILKNHVGEVMHVNDHLANAR